MGLKQMDATELPGPSGVHPGLAGFVPTISTSQPPQGHSLKGKTACNDNGPVAQA